MLRLTRPDGAEVYVSINHIVSMETTEDGAFIETPSGCFTVKERVSRIYEWINEAKGLSA